MAGSRYNHYKHYVKEDPYSSLAVSPQSVDNNTLNDIARKMTKKDEDLSREFVEKIHNIVKEKHIIVEDDNIFKRELNKLYNDDDREERKKLMKKVIKVTAAIIVPMIIILTLFIAFMASRTMITYYYEDNCPYCDEMKIAWDYAKDNNKFINITKEVNSKDAPSTITNFPTIILYNPLSKKEFTYNGDADGQQLSQWFKSNNQYSIFISS